MKKIKFFLLSFFVFILFFTLTSFVFGSSPTVTVTANPTSLQNSGTSTITWSSTNATECNTNGHGTATSGSFLTPVISTNTNYHVSCDKDACVEGWPPLNFGCANKTTQQACAAVINTRALPPEPACDWTNVYAQNSANVTIVPTVTVTATPSVVSSGGSSSISWTSPSTATSCTMTGGGLSVSGKSNSGISTGSLSSTTTYTVSCILNQVNSDCLSGFPGATMWPSNNPNNQGNSYGTGEQFCHSRDTSQATCDAAQASPGGEDPVQNVCEWSPGSPGTTLSGSATVTVADNNVSCQSMVATSTTNGSSNISWTSTNANTCNSGGHGTGISGFFTVTPTTTTTYPISCTRNAQTISGPCSGTYSVQSGSCGGEEVSGSVCGGSVPGGDEGDPCSSFNSQGSCVITGDPWCHHGCHWNFSNTTASCSDFTIQSSCTAHSGCNWGAGYTVPSATTTCPATVNVVRVNAFTQNNTPSLYLPYQGDSTAKIRWGTPGMDNTYECYVYKGSSLQNQTQYQGPFRVDVDPKEFDEPNPPSFSPTFYSVKCQKINNTNLLYLSNNIDVHRRPDLIAGAVITTPANLTPGTSFAFNAPITDQGPVATEDGFYNFFQWTDTNPGNNSYSLKKSEWSNFFTFFPKAFAGGTITDIPTDGGGIPMNFLGAGATATATSASSVYFGNGVHYARACADKKNSGDNGSIDESDETNNCGPWTTITVAPAAGPDLYVYSYIIPTTATVGQSTTLKATIKNKGSLTTGSNFKNFFQISNYDPGGGGSGSMSKVSKPSLFARLIPKAFATQTPPGGTVSDFPSFVLGPLASGASAQGQTVSTSFFPSSGIYYVRACADKKNSTDLGTISETNEANNCSSWVEVNVGTGGNYVPVSGSCATNHYFCINGTSINQNNTPTAWTWTCQGSQNTSPPGGNVSCVETKATMTGTLTPTKPNQTSCIITTGNSNCTINFDWNVSNPIGNVSAVVRPNPNYPPTPPPGYIAGTGALPVSNYPLVVKYNSETFYLYNNATPLASASVTSSCESGSNWNPTTSKCESNLPDLTASYVSPAWIQTNQSVKFFSDITNQGNASTGHGFDNFFQTVNSLDGSGQPIGTVTDIQPPSPINSSLGVNASQTIYSVSQLFTQDATIYARACADKSNRNTVSPGSVLESDETNNCGPWTMITISSQVINGECLMTHFGCAKGNSIENVNGSAPNNPWTWKCQGVGVGSTTASCTENYVGCPSGTSGTPPNNCICNNNAVNSPDCNLCANGAGNPPTCTVCATGTSGTPPNCTCNNTAIDPPYCTTCANGAVDPPHCTLCGAGTSGTPPNCTCNNTAINPPACTICKNGADDPPDCNHGGHCFNNVKDGDETGVDCGGSCVKVCQKAPKYIER